MKVRTCENVEVDVTVDVDVNAVLCEFSEQFTRAEGFGDLPVNSCYLPLIDFATKLMARIPSAAIAKCKDSQRAEVVKRLRDEAERWNTIIVSAE